MPVITLSRQIGTGADQIANQLCTDLGLIAFDKRLMLQVASDLGVGEHEIVDYSEDQYKQRTFFEALFRRARPVAEVTAWTGGRTGGYEREVRILDEAQAINLVRASVVAAYERGNVLIIGRGSQAILEDRPGVLHVRLVAPFEKRVEALQKRDSITAAQARRLIADSDRATEEYLRTFYQLDVNDSTPYHLVLNTAKLGVDKAVALIKAALQEVVAEASAAS
ncbi:MAG: cytidylate kinase-like family protein [Chloroflexota bacterium]